MFCFFRYQIFIRGEIDHRPLSNSWGSIMHDGEGRCVRVPPFRCACLARGMLVHHLPPCACQTVDSLIKYSADPPLGSTDPDPDTTIASTDLDPYPPLGFTGPDPDTTIALIDLDPDPPIGSIDLDPGPLIGFTDLDPVTSLGSTDLDPDPSIGSTDLNPDLYLASIDPDPDLPLGST